MLKIYLKKTCATFLDGLGNNFQILYGFEFFDFWILLRSIKLRVENLKIKKKTYNSNIFLFATINSELQI